MELRLVKWIAKSESGCSEWVGARFKSGGYGAINIDQKARRVMRVVWELAYGPIPPGLIIRHRCDNPPCVRIDHLELGTFAENTDDAIRRGRSRNQFGPWQRTETASR